MFKKRISIMMVLVLLLAFSPRVQASSAIPPVTVILAGSVLVFDSPPIIESGRVHVPLRVIFEALEATVQWYAQDQRIVATRRQNTIEMTIGKTMVSRNGRPEVIDSPPRIVNKRTLVPLRFVSQALGADVLWDALARTVTITPVSDRVSALRAIYIPWMQQKEGDTIKNTVETITKSAQNDYEKAFAIFMWISTHLQHIDQDYGNVLPLPGTAEWTEMNKPENVFRNRLGAHDGYAALFYQMSALAGLESAIITGYSRSPNEERPPNGTNPLRRHTWNAVRINNEWHLIDTVQGGGLISYVHQMWGKELQFVPYYSPYFFMTNPNELIFINMPSDPKWQLADNSITLEQFRRQPVKGRAFFVGGLKLVSHKDGVIEVTEAEAANLVIRIKAAKYMQAGLSESIYPGERHLLANPVITREGDYLLFSPSPRTPGSYTIRVNMNIYPDRPHGFRRVVEYLLVIR